MKRIVFHTLLLGDVDDPEIYAAGPLYEFMQTPKGRWLKENCSDPLYRISPDPNTFGFKVQVYGELEEKKAVEYLLRWNKEQS